MTNLWTKVYVDGICTGVGIEVFEGYHEMICNTILPDTDEEYGHQKDEIEQDMDLICAAPEMKEVLIMAMSTIMLNGSPELTERYETLIKVLAS